MTTTTVTVQGMTCGHCVEAVRSEVAKIDGVTGVEVDLESGRVDIDSDRPVAEADLRAAVDEAGYELVS